MVLVPSNASGFSSTVSPRNHGFETDRTSKRTREYHIPPRRLCFLFSRPMRYPLPPVGLAFFPSGIFFFYDIYSLNVPNKAFRQALQVPRIGSGPTSYYSLPFMSGYEGLEEEGLPQFPPLVLSQRMVDPRPCGFCILPRPFS